jgi:hypothetical protein
MPVPIQAGAIPVAPLGGAEVARVSPNDPFILVHHAGYPGSWSVEKDGFDAPTWVPAIDRLVLAVGSNGVASIADGEDPRSAHRATREIVMRQGIVQIEVPGSIVAESCMCPRTFKPGTYYRTAWERVEPPANPTANAKLRLDRAGWNRWRAELARDGVVAPPHPSVVAACRADYIRALDQARGATSLAADVRDAKIARALAELEAFDNAVKPWEAPAVVEEVPAVVEGPPARKKGAA